MNHDVYLNITGGIKVFETAADLAIILSVFSSLNNITFKSDTAVIGEVGLSGEIRSVSNLNKRIKSTVYGIQPSFSAKR